LQTVEHHHFSSLAEVSAYLKILSPKERFRIVNKQASKLVAVQENMDKYMEYLEDFVGEDVYPPPCRKMTICQDQ
jgi:hypothetical protein